MQFKRLAAGSACWLLILAAGAAGQSQPDKPLGGPEIGKERPPHLQDRFGEGRGDRRDAMAERGIPMPAYQRIIGQLRGESAPEGLRLSEDQERKIAAIEQDFRESMRGYAQKARQEAGDGDRPARPRAARRGQGDQAGEKPDQMAPPDAEAVRERREEIRRNAPKPQDWQVKMWAVLSAPQQKFVDEQVKAVQAELEKRRGEEYMKRQIERMEKENAARPPAPPPDRPNAGAPDRPGPAAAGPEGRERGRRVLERLQQLPPEQRQRILQRLEEELDRLEGNRPSPARRGSPRADEAKPPPPMDQVNVPPPPRRR